MKALAVSCNYYFYEAGYRTGIDCHRQRPPRPSASASRPASSCRRPPASRANPETKKELYPDDRASGRLVRRRYASPASIGQSENTLHAPAAVLSYISGARQPRRALYRPTLRPSVVLSVGLSEAASSEQTSPVAGQHAVTSRTRPTPPIPEGMRLTAVTSGTAYSAFVGYDVAVCAKTGTAQHGSGGSDNALVRAAMPRRTTRRSPLRSMWKRARRAARSAPSPAIS